MGLSGFLGGAALGGALGGTGIHKYDTGLFRAQRTVVRHAIADLLKPLLVPSLGGSSRGYVRSIKALPKALRHDSEQELSWIGNAVQGQTPCIVIALGRKTYAPRGVDGPAVEYVSPLEAHIYAVTSVARDYVDGRLGSDVVGTSSANADPGIDTLLEHIEELLIGQDPDIKTIHEFRPQSEDELHTDGDLTIWEQVYELVVERSINPGRLASLLMTSIEVQSQINDGVDPTTGTVVDTITTLGVP